jgi:hypothetical protein
MDKRDSPAARANHVCGAQYPLIPYVPKSRPAEFFAGRIEEQANESYAILLEHSESRMDYNRHIGTLVQQEIDCGDLLSHSLAFGLQTPDFSQASLIVSVNSN